MEEVLRPTPKPVESSLANPTSRAASVYKIVALLTFNTLLLLLGIELVAFVLNAVHPPPSSLDLDFAYAPYRMMKASRAPFPLDSDGFRAPELPGLAASTRDDFVIVFLGGSVCVGLGHDVGSPLPDLLQSRLNDLGLTQARVVDLCQGGAVSAQELAILTQFGLSLHPQLVISFDGANDFFHPQPLGPDDGPNEPFLNSQLESLWPREKAPFLLDALTHTSTFELLERLSSNPAGLGRIRRAIELKNRPPVPIDSIVSAYVGNLDMTQKLAAAYGAKHMVVLQPSVWVNKPMSPEERAPLTREYSDMDATARRVNELYARAINSLSSWQYAGGSPVFDVTDAFASEPRTMYIDSVHFANKAAYPKLLDDLEQHGMIAQIQAQYQAWQAAR